MHRINQSHRITSLLSSPDLYHAVGQGALAVEIRRGDNKTREVIRGLGHWQTEWRVGAERGCLRVLEGGCSVPVGVETELVELTEEEIAKLDISSIDKENSWSSDLEPLSINSPTLHFSGLLDRSQPYPDTAQSQPSSPGHGTGPTNGNGNGNGKNDSTSDDIPAHTPRFATLSLKTCVTSLDGVTQVIHAPPPVYVRSYAEAERWGEHCARIIKEEGGGQILDEINELRKQREEAELQEGLRMSRREAGMETPGIMTPGLNTPGFWERKNGLEAAGAAFGSR
jgi:hydroxymethylbilane synthase